jgi:flagellar motility protein MotE (MotC chaperone)
MTKRKRLIAILAAANGINAIVVAGLLSWGWLSPPASAEESELPAKPAAERGALDPSGLGEQHARETYLQLIDELTEQKARLDARAEQLAERERQFTVLRQELIAERQRIEASGEQVAAERAALESMRSPSFDQLLKAYEGMEPENAASALTELYAKDRLVVVDLLLGIKARQAAGTLDALAASSPEIAADLSLEIWKRDPDRRRR